jgi:hypothetical protein
LRERILLRHDLPRRRRREEVQPVAEILML